MMYTLIYHVAPQVGEQISFVLLRRRQTSPFVYRCADGATESSPHLGSPTAAFNRYLAMTMEQMLELGQQVLFMWLDLTPFLEITDVFFGGESFCVIFFISCSDRFFVFLSDIW